MTVPYLWGKDTDFIEKHFGEEGSNKTIVSLPRISKYDLVLFEKGLEKRPESKSNEIEGRMRIVFALIVNDPTVSRVETGRILGAPDKQVKLALEKFYLLVTIWRTAWGLI